MTQVHIRKIYGKTGIETGSILSASFPTGTNSHQKKVLEDQMDDHARNNLYPSIPLNVFSDVNADTPSITVIKDINDLDGVDISI